MSRPSPCDRQAEVHLTLQELGGYWRPLAATARVLEELGELAELLDDTTSESLRDELADLWIITTAVANQFLVEVTPPNSTPHPDRLSRSELFSKLWVHAGQLARATNHYDGPKAPRTMKGWIPLRDSIPRLHRCLSGIAHACAIDLDAAVRGKLHAIIDRDAMRFEQGFDPSSSQALVAFGRVQEASRCPFASSARLWGAPEWNDEGSIEANVDAVVPSMTRFCKAAEAEHLDGFVIEVRNGRAVRDLEALARVFAMILGHLVRSDPKVNECLRTELEVRGWQFQFHELRMFVSVHSPLYPSDHVRHTPSGTFVFFQPESCFDRFEIGSKFEGSAEIKASVREAFYPMRYPCDLIDSRIEARLYFLSDLEPGRLAYHRWWEHLPETMGQDVHIS